jgi:hypothetical protein
MWPINSLIITRKRLLKHKSIKNKSRKTKQKSKPNSKTHKGGCGRRRK